MRRRTSRVSRKTEKFLLYEQNKEDNTGDVLDDGNRVVPAEGNMENEKNKKDKQMISKTKVMIDAYDVADASTNVDTPVVTLMGDIIGDIDEQSSVLISVRDVVDDVDFPVPALGNVVGEPANTSGVASMETVVPDVLVEESSNEQNSVDDMYAVTSIVMDTNKSLTESVVEPVENLVMHIEHTTPEISVVNYVAEDDRLSHHHWRLQLSL